MNDKRTRVFKDDLTSSGLMSRPLARAEQVNSEDVGSCSRRTVPSQSPVAAATTTQAPQSAKVSAVEPSPAMSAHKRQEQRRYRTGRNQQLNLKVRAQDAEAFYAIADAEGWVLGDAFARAVAALAREREQTQSQ